MKENKSNKKSILSSEAFPGILLLSTTVLALILANTPLDKFYNFLKYDIKFGEELNLHLIINDFLKAI